MFSLMNDNRLMNMIKENDERFTFKSHFPTCKHVSIIKFTQLNDKPFKIFEDEIIAYSENEDENVIIYFNGGSVVVKNSIKEIDDFFKIKEDK